MRTQAFGVEIETKGLGPEKAAQVIAQALGTAPRGSQVADPTTGKIWKAVPDGSLSGVSAEIVTPKLTYDEIPKLQEVVRALRRAGARVDRQCGIHVHVDAARHDGKSLARLVKLIHSKEELLFKALQINEARLARYAQRVDQRFLDRIVRSGPRDMRQLNRAWYGRENRHPGRYDSTRYHGLNLHAVWDKGTIEFRYFNGTLHAGQVKAYIQLCLALSHKALTAHGARHRATRTTNEKFTFRVWLVGLGMKGDEFKTARKHLTENLSGNSAWRYNQNGPRRQAPAAAPQAAGQADARHSIYLENRTGDHFKFYRIEWNGRLAVQTTWGRIGTDGRSKEERFGNDYALQACVQLTLNTRLDHGYTLLSDSRQS